MVVVVLTLYVFTYHDDMRSNYKKGSNFKLILFQNGFSFSVSKYVFHLIVSTLVRELLFFEKSANSCQETRFETHKATFNTKFVTITTNNNIMVITAIETSLQKKSLVK